VSWGSIVEVETRNRIILSVAAYAYEAHNQSFLSDAEYDDLAKSIDTSVKTKSRKLDNFFKKFFNPDTGMWVLRHPDRRGLEHLYFSYYEDKCI